MKLQKSSVKTWVVLSDIQIPFEDTPVLSTVVEFIQELKPHGVVLNGDIIDAYELSTYDKNPLTRAGLDIEIAKASELMTTLAKSTTTRIWLGGNHEDRLRRYLWKNAPALRLDAVTEFDRLFQVKAHGFVWKPYGEFVQLGKLLVTHGSVVSKHSGWTAKAHFDKYGKSVLVGHSHRQGAYYRTNLYGVHVAYENGCLCRLDPEYVQLPDWQQGFSVVHVHGNGYFSAQQIPILDGLFYYGSECYRVKR